MVQLLRIKIFPRKVVTQSGQMKELLADIDTDYHQCWSLSLASSLLSCSAPLASKG
jgi:hypothetical protein